MKKTLETDTVLFEIFNGVLIVTYRENIKITLKQAKEVVALRLQFIDHISKPTLVVNAGTLNADKKARDYFSSEEGIAGIKCAALLVNSNFASLMLSFFLKITRPKLLVKIFTNKEDALTWLANHID
jgi:hypothetical protein